jgi:hypothetical protein
MQYFNENISFRFDYDNNARRPYDCLVLPVKAYLISFCCSCQWLLGGQDKQNFLDVAET